MCWTVTIPINGLKRGTVLFLVVVAATIPSPSSSTGTSIHLGQSHFYSFLMTVLQYDWAIYWNDVRRLNFWNLVRLKPDPQSPITALWFFFIKYFSNIYSTAMNYEQNLHKRSRPAYYCTNLTGIQTRMNIIINRLEEKNKYKSQSARQPCHCSSESGTIITAEQ